MLPAPSQHVQVPTGHVWIQGDNLTHSLDSRQYGPVPLAMVRGRVLVQVGHQSYCSRSLFSGWMPSSRPGTQPTC